MNFENVVLLENVKFELVSKNLFVKLLLFQVLSDGVSLGLVSGDVTKKRRFVSTNGQLTVIFRSNAAVQYQGYEAYFSIASEWI